MKHSAGILVYRVSKYDLEVLLEHPGGPYFNDTDDEQWCIPKGEIEQGEDILAAALREFKEETNLEIPDNVEFLGTFQQSRQKTIHIYCVYADELDLSAFASNVFTLEWPSGSGNFSVYPEADDVRWFTFEDAWKMIFPGQRKVLGALRNHCHL